MSPERVSSEGKVKVIPRGGTEDGKGVGTNSRSLV